jgi:hypothetical protein
MPALRPPRFRLNVIDDTTMRLEYYSTRQGLAPMVVGLLKGLAIRFDTPVEIAHASRDGHEEFTIKTRRAA